MADNLHLKVITPLKLVIDEHVELVEAPGELGEFGILPGHVPFVTTLNPGFLKFRQGSETRSLVIHGGHPEVSNDNVRILTDSTEDPSSIDTDAAKRDIDNIQVNLFTTSTGSTDIILEMCPECGDRALAFETGCMTCKSCAYSKCS